MTGPDSTVPGPFVYCANELGVTLDTASGSLEVLRDVEFQVRPGEIVGIVGRSGSGKTTLLRLLGGFIRPTVGSVLLDGDRLDRPSTKAITVFQDYGNALLPWRTVSLNVGLGLERHLSRSERVERVAEALDLVDLAAFANEYPWRLSGGMQQRVQIARALAMRPEVLLMDEPFGALDAITKTALQDRLLAIHEKAGTTILFITHDLDEALYLSDKVFVISGTPGSGQPGTLTMSATTGLARPRDQVTTREAAGYLELRHRLMSILHVGEDVPR